jgi:hypothetical protein
MISLWFDSIASAIESQGDYQVTITIANDHVNMPHVFMLFINDEIDI